jgi:hypothetical protein
VTDLRRIIEELEQQKNAIEAALKALRGLGTTSTAPLNAAGAPRRRRMSAEGRRRIAEATRKRWAEQRASAAGAKKTVKKAASKKMGVKKRAAKKATSQPARTE